MRRHATQVLISVLLAGLLTFPAVAEDLFFDSDGAKIRYTDTGEGDPVVLLHGLATSLDLFAMMGWPTTLGDYRVIAMDVRGHGKSDKPHSPESYGIQLAEDVRRLLDHLEIDRAHVVGYSMGGMITLNLITLHPDRLISAVIGGFGLSPEYESPEDSVMYQAAASLDRGEGLLPIFEALTPEGRPLPSKEELAAINQFLMSSNDTKALAALLRSDGLRPSEKALRKNRVPTLAIIGELDGLKPDVDRLAGVMGSLRVVVVEGADHMTAGGSPVFREEMLAFLASPGPEKK